ncbi:hypothetical protein B0H66DRAFT_300672 [Apodospora peruviana]|uniref:Uncharacterized protein n=1 Tax=Apodospora peruviana TaxID=516989 RepID=A0AAE0M2H7_9PEZI|nr:hypothetical protein B0H66DRAFT_300672 [Apodospora peruviana]
MHGSSIFSHIVSRSIQVVRQTSQDGSTATIPDEIRHRLSSRTAICVLVVTTLIFMVFFTLVEYPVRFVIGTLAIVERTSETESPTAAEASDYVELDGLLSDESDNDKNPGSGCVVTDVEADNTNGRKTMTTPTKGPVTKDIGTAMAHLRARRGFRSLYRGFRFGMAYSILDLLVQTLALPTRFNPIIVDLICIFVLVGIHCSWTHAILRASHPANDGARFQQNTKRTGCARFIPGVWSRHLVLPTIRYILHFTASVMGTLLASFFARRQHDKIKASHQDGSVNLFIAVVLALFPIVVGLLAFFTLLLPSWMAYVRVEASLLPESDSTVVPFDRTYGGRLDRSDATSWVGYVIRNLTTYGAWKTVGWKTYKRVISIYLKFLLLSVVILLSFSLIYALELYAILGQYSGDFMVSFHAGVHMRRLITYPSTDHQGR